MESVLTFPRTVFREDHEMLRKTVRRFLESECKPRQSLWDTAGRVDRETWLKAGREGLLCATMDVQWGGGGGDRDDGGPPPAEAPAPAPSESQLSKRTSW